MKNIFLIIIAVAILGAVGLVVFSKSTVAPTVDSPITPANSAQPQPASDSQVNDKESGKYVEYSPNTLQSNSNQKRVLFFYANWCPTCIPSDKAFQSSQNQIPEGVVVIRVNYNDSDTDQAEKDLAAQYGITYQHTFVQIDSQGSAITRWNGGDISELLKQLR